jgi:diketogulonate reductase-like aldo/keto reductase
MKIQNKSLKSGFTMPVFGLGTWMIGGDMEKNTHNDKEDIQAIRNAIESGITHIDTAEKYAEGHSEELVGEAIANVDRSELFLVTKVASDNLGYEDLLKSCKASMKRMKVQYLDMFMIHSPSLEIPIDETMKAMDTLIRDGLIRNIAVSNFSVVRLKEVQKVSKHPIVANQLHYNLLIRENEKNGLLDYCQKNDIMFIAWRPLQKGELCCKGIPIMDEMADKYDKTPAQIAINWLISQKNIVTLSKMGSKKHLDENLGSLGWEMNKDDIERLRREFPNQQFESDSVPLSKYVV